MYFILCLTKIFLLQFIHGMPSSQKIDKFIDELMKSDRFEMLTDMIAEKTINKINVLNSKKKINLRESKVQAMQVVSINNKQTSKIPPTTPKSSNNKKKQAQFGEIDTNSFLNQEPTETLHLKFKKIKEVSKKVTTKNPQTHFKKIDKKHVEEESKHVGEQSKHDDKESKHDEQETKHVEEEVNPEYNENPIINEFISQETQKQEENNDKSQLEDENDKNFKALMNNGTKNEEINDGQVVSGEVKSDEQIDFQKDAEIVDEPTQGEANEPVVEGSAEISSPLLEEDAEKTVVDKNMNSNYEYDMKSSKEIIEVSINRTRSDENYRNHVVARKRIVREENGKNYTLNTSTEYEEYHDKLSQLQKKIY